MRKWQRIASISGLAALVLAGGLLAEQSESAEKSVSQVISDPLGTDDLNFQYVFLKLRNKELRKEDSDTERAAALEQTQRHHEIFSGAARSRVVADAIMHQALWQFSRDKTAVQSAPQACQVAAEQTFKLSLLQAQQNQRIIELLEEIAKKPK